MKLFILCLVFTLSGCAALGEADAKKVAETMLAYPVGDHEKVFWEFVNNAKKGDVEGMMSLTSDKTIEIVGEKCLRDNYQDEKVIIFQKCEIENFGKNVEFVGSGWRFSFDAINPNIDPMYLFVTVLTEDGEIKITQIGSR